MAGLRGSAHGEARWLRRAPPRYRTIAAWRRALATAVVVGPLPSGAVEYRAGGMRLIAVDGVVATVLPLGWPADGKHFVESPAAELNPQN